MTTLLVTILKLNIRLTVFMSILTFPNLDNWVIWLYLSPENNILSFTLPINSLSFHFKCHYINYYLVHFKSISYCPVFINRLSFCPKNHFKIFQMVSIFPPLWFWGLYSSIDSFFFFLLFGLYSYIACNIFTLSYVSFLFVKCQCAECKENIFLLPLSVFKVSQPV